VETRGFWFTRTGYLVILLSMQSPSFSQQIPGSAIPFFQEYDVDLLDVNEDASLIIERILAYGNRAEVRWLLKTYGQDRVCNWVRQTGPARLSKRRYHLWCFVFDLPEQNRPAQVWKY